MSQVSQAYQNLSRSLQTGMKGIGEAHIGGAKMGLLEAQQEAELNDPVRLFKQEEARIKIQKMSMPYNILTAMGGEDINAFENLIALADKSNPDVSVVDILPFQHGYIDLRITNEKHESDPQGSAKYYKPGTNEYFTMGHYEANIETFNKIIFAEFNRFNHHRATLENFPPESDEFKDAIDFLNNPARQVRELAEDAENMRIQGLDGAASGVYERIDRIQKNMQLEISGREKLKDQWTDIYPGPEGTWLRKNLTTGKPEQVIGRPPAGKAPKDEKQKYLKDTANLYKYHIGQYNQASRSVGQFLEDPNKERIAKESLERALTIAIQHKKAGGDPADLGITPEAIKEQYDAERITKDKAAELLRTLFGME